MGDTESPLGAVEVVATSLYVSDLDEAVAWYAEKLGLYPMMVGADGDRYATFLMAGTLVVLEPLTAALEPSEPGSESSTINLLVSREPKDVRDELTERGVVCSELVASPNYVSFLIRDLDGNRFYVSRAVSQQAQEAVRDVTRADA